MALGRGDFSNQFGFNNWPLIDEDLCVPSSQSSTFSESSANDKPGDLFSEEEKK
jgi:hypothetical protein